MILKIKTNLLCGTIVFAALLVGGCASDSEEVDKSITVIDLDSLQQKTKQLAGKDALDCGDIRLVDGAYANDKAEADCCMAMSLAQGTPFYVMYQEIDFDSTRGRGYLSNELGELSVHTWDSVAPGGGRYRYNPFSCQSLELTKDACNVPTNELPFCVRS